MTTSDRDIVTGLQLALATRIGRERFDLWFGTAVSIELIDRTLRIAVRDQFTLDRIRQCFQVDIREVCSAELGYQPELDLRICSELSAAASAAGVGDETEGVRPQGASMPSSVPTPQMSQAAAATRRQLETFGSFVEGASNKIAYTAAVSVAQQPGTVSPLYLYGPTGSGKTHLLEAIMETTRGSMSRRRCVMLSAEQFTTYFLSALHEQGLPTFRRKYRDVELLLIDDLQFFTNKRATIVELQHTIDTLLREGRQLVFAADRSPAELTGFGRELTARIAGGLVCRLEPADQQTRLGIVRRLAQRRHWQIPEAVLELLADRLEGDARQLSGALNRLHATSLAHQEPITVRVAEEALEDLFFMNQPLVRLPDIERAVCDLFGLDTQSLHSTRKGKTVSHPRMLAMWLARKHTRAAFSEIGYYFGRRSHSTVISAQNKVKRWVAQRLMIQLRDTTCSVEDAIRRIEQRLRAG